MTIGSTDRRWVEDFEVYTEEEQILIDEVGIMEANSVWYDGLVSKELQLIGIPSPIESVITAQQYQLDLERTVENAGGFSTKAPDGKDRATGLILAYQQVEPKLGIVTHYKNISRASWGTLCETAKLNGSALTRMAPLQLSSCLNSGLDVARGQTLLLVRFDKVMGMHSDSDSGYCIMPISELLNIARHNLEDKFGTVEFVQGRHSNVYTTALWQLPDAQGVIIDKYKDALKNAASHIHPVNFMPAVRFSASDTARSSAVMKPMFLKSNGTAFTFGGDIAVKHERKRTGIYGVDLFEQETSGLFAKFDETVEAIKKMAETDIYNPVNCFVGIINYLNRGNSVIKRQYADAARIEVERSTINYPVMSMHDIYLYMSECITAARLDGVKNTIKIEEALAKVLTMNWRDFDVGGTVAWGEKGAI